jgi:hypothetical protein
MKPSSSIGPTAHGTLCVVGACVVGYFLSLQLGQPSEIARMVSIALLLGIAGSFLLDWRKGLRNLIRVDVFAFLAFYFLTFFEFLFPQGRFDFMVIPEDVVEAMHLLIAGLLAMAIGRHLSIFPKGILDRVAQVEMRSGDFLVVFFLAAILNFFPSLMVVNYNPFAWFEQTLLPRFSRVGGRGQLGGLSTLVNELQLLGYIVPPLAGLIMARAKEYKVLTLVMVGLVLLLLWYSAFSSGTRNIFAVQVAGFFAGFFLMQRRLRLKIIIPTILVVGVLFVVLADHMLAFRNMGLGQYVEGGYYKPEYKEFQQEYLGDGLSFAEETEEGYFVDYNLWSLSLLVSAFPEAHDFIGWNMPFVALTKPVPRALWPGKPVDFEVGLEEAAGIEQMTIAVTWVGEAFIAGGLVWTIGIGLLIGAFCGYWNHLARYLHSPFALIVFASGFYATLLLMRSLIFFTTALLPSMALIIMGLVIHHKRKGAV